MAPSRHYRNAPITEALLDIQVELSDVSLEVLGTFRQKIVNNYPKEQKRSEFRGEFHGGEVVAAKAEQKEIGFAFTSPDQKQVVQARLNGFTFSRLAPYEDWDKFRDEAKLLWNHYLRVVRPKKISGVVLRYINQIIVPKAFVDLKDYLRTYPEIAPELNQILEGYLMQLQIAQPDLGCTLVLIQTIVPSPPETVAFILDQGLMKQNADFKSEDELWNLIEQLRLRKNEIFENCITDQTRELIS